MDPNETLKQLRSAVNSLSAALATVDAVESLVGPFGDYEDEDVRSVIEHFRALDRWLSRGGFLPQDWDRA